MKVVLPNGKEIDGVPEGTSKTAIMRKAVNAGLATYADFADKSDPMLDPTGSFGRNLVEGFGKAFVDMGRGAGQRLGLVSESDVARSRQLDAPLMDTAGGVVGNIVGNAAPAMALSLNPAVATVKGAAALGAGAGLLAPTTKGENVAENVVTGAGFGAAGQGLANTIGRIVRPVRSTLDDSVAPLAAKASKLGINLNAAQRTGSKALRYLDSALDAMPFTGDKQAVLKGAQRKAWQKALLGQLGETSEEATPAVLNAARKRIGGEFEEIAGRNVVQLADDFIDTLANAESKLTEFSPKSARTAIDKALNLAVRAEQSGGVIDGASYQTVRSSIQKAVDKAFSGGNTDLARTLQSIRTGLDDAAEASINPGDAAAWMKARSQWKLLKRIEKAVDPTSGDISPKKLFNEMARKDVMNVKYGRGNQTTTDLAKIGREFIAENLPDSGTAQRQMWQNLLTGGGGAMGAGALMGMIPPAALLGATASAATPLAAQRMLWSPGGARYLTQGLAPNLSPLAGQLGHAAAGGAASLPLLLKSLQE